MEDFGAGIKGEWIETGKKRAVGREHFCPLAMAATACPEIAEHLIGLFERGTFNAIRAKVKDLHFEKLLPKGDPYCEVVVELED